MAPGAGRWAEVPGTARPVTRVRRGATTLAGRCGETVRPAARTRSPATTSCSASASTSTSRGSWTATSGRPISRRRSTWSSSGPPARLREDAAALRERAAPARWTMPARRALARRPARRDRGPAPRASPASRCPTSTTSTTLLRLPAGPPAGRRVRRAAAARIDDARSRATGRWPTGSAAWDARFVDPAGPARRRRRLARGAGSASGRATVRAARRARTCGSGWSRDQPWSGYNWYDGGLPVAGRHQHGPAGPRAGLVDTVAHETYPGHHLEHAWKEADLVDARGRARGVDPADQHARVPDQRGSGGPRHPVRVAARRRRPTCCVELYEPRRTCRSPPTRRPRATPRSGPSRCAGRAATPRRIRGQRGAPAPRRRRGPRGGPRLPRATSA